MDDYLKVIEECTPSDEMLFRGQSQDWPLIPKIGRIEKRDKRDHIKEVEGRITREFKRRQGSFSGINCDNDWELLCIAQHHGMPTRLLDWTTNALAALWFSVNKSKKGNGSSFVYIYCPKDSDFLDLEYSQNNGPYDIHNTMFFKPLVNNARVQAQSGFFSVHSCHDEYGFLDFKKHSNLSGELIQIKIPNSYRWVIRYDLDRCGVNELSLFPDLDGLSGYLEWLYTCVDDEIGKKRSKVKRKP